jgi:hypothetical protein
MKYLLSLVLLLASAPGHAQRPVAYSAPVYKASLRELTAQRTALATAYLTAAVAEIARYDGISGLGGHALELLWQ